METSFESAPFAPFPIFLLSWVAPAPWNFQEDRGETPGSLPFFLRISGVSHFFDVRMPSAPVPSWNPWREKSQDRSVLSKALQAQGFHAKNHAE